jgi:hypothetical protein
MPEYRVFRLAETGKILGPSFKVKYESDEEAIRELRKTSDDVTLEIWDMHRRVAIIWAHDPVTGVS